MPGGGAVHSINRQHSSRYSITLGTYQERSRHSQTERLGAVVLGPREHDLLQLKFFRLVERELSASPTTDVHEKDRIPVIWPLDTFAPVANAIGFRRLVQSIDLAVAAEELGADGAYFRVHHFARQLGSPSRVARPPRACPA